MRLRHRHTFGLFFLALLLATPPGKGSLCAQTPTDTFRLVQRVALTARFAATDNLGQLYFITDENAVEKYTADGQFLFRYSNNRLGSAAWLDVTNPMKVLVWYADFRTVVFLNRSLTELGALNLISAGSPEVRTVALAADGNLWLYDEVAFQLKKLTPDGTVLFESQALNLLQTERINLHTLRDDGEKVWASDPDIGILCFDVYGQYQQTLPWKGISAFVLAPGRLEYLSDGRFHLENLRTFQSASIPLPAAALEAEARVWLSAGRVLIGLNDHLEVWTRGG